MKLPAIIKQITDKSNRVKLLTFMGVAAILLILISEMIPRSDRKESETTAETIAKADNSYTDNTEVRLKELLSKIKGVGKTDLILSAECGEEYVFAEELETSSDKGEKDSSEKYKNKLFISDKNGSKEAVVKKVINPRFNGALVICEGGGDALIKERVIKAVSAALDLPTSKICVESRTN